MTAPFGPREVDALQEHASIGCGQAITALGKLARRRFEMDVPEAWVGAGPGAIASFLGGLGQDLVAVGVKLEGPLTGDLLLALPESDAENLAAMLGYPPSDRWGGLAESALMESGNIVGSAFVTAVGALVKEKLLLSVPTFARGSGRACVERLGDVATLDTHRTLRVGMPEVVLAESKTAAQIAAIARKLARRGPLLVTRLTPDRAGPARRAVKGSVYDPVSRTLRRGRMDLPTRGPVAVCCAGTSDIPVCEEAAVTLDVMGVEVIRIYDVGVAGLHRLLARRDDLERARAVVVAAGMEGALPSVVGGLVGRPVIGVPTSVGYGASLGGLAPLFTMLNSCAPNVTVVNVDNGFGAAFVAGLVARE